MPQDVSYAVFGLGNKQYEHFAAVGKRLHKALAALGAVAVCPRGDGDDDDDIDADFDAWQADLLTALDTSPLVPAPKVNPAACSARLCRREGVSVGGLPHFTKRRSRAAYRLDRRAAVRVCSDQIVGNARRGSMGPGLNCCSSMGLAMVCLAGLRPAQGGPAGIDNGRVGAGL